MLHAHSALELYFVSLSWYFIHGVYRGYRILLMQASLFIIKLSFPILYTTRIILECNGWIGNQNQMAWHQLMTSQFALNFASNRILIAIQRNEEVGATLSISYSGLLKLVSASTETWSRKFFFQTTAKYISSFASHHIASSPNSLMYAGAWLAISCSCVPWHANQPNMCTHQQSPPGVVLSRLPIQWCDPCNAQSPSNTKDNHPSKFIGVVENSERHIDTRRSGNNCSG